MNMKILSLVVIVSLLLGGVGAAELYKWVDEKGAVYFSDKPPEDTDSVRDVKSIPTRKYRTPPPSHSAYAAKERSDGSVRESQRTEKETLRRAPKVELYTTSWCGYCGKARDYFRSRGIAFKEYDIERDQSAARRKTSLDPRGGVPFAVVNGQSILGFAPAAYAKALELTP